MISARQKKAQAKSLNSGLEIGAVASLMRQIREQRRLAELCRGQTPALVTGRRLPPPPGELAARSGGRPAGGEERAAATVQQLSIKIESLRVVIHGAVLVKRQGGRKEFKTQVQDISNLRGSSGVSQFRTEFQTTKARSRHKS